MKANIFFLALSINLSILNFYIYENLKKIKIKFLGLFFIILTSFQIIAIFSLRSTFININLQSIINTTIVFSLCIFFSFFIKDMLFVSKKVINKKEINKDRRNFLKLGVDIWFLLLGFLLSFRAIYNACFDVVINRVDINLKNLKNDLKVAMISDLHLGKYLRGDFLSKIVKKINDENVDCVFIVGDLIDIEVDYAKNDLNALNKFNSSVFYVTGNHEYYYGIDKVINLLKKYNIKILNNENVNFKGINIVGVNDLSGLKIKKYPPDLKKALSGIKNNDPKILLAHQPKYVNNFVKDEVELCLCGHTHGGSFFPMSILVYLDQKFLKGLFKLKDKQLFVSSGLGFWGPPIRFFAPSEIAILNLKGSNE